MKKETYVAPIVEVIEIKIEKGFEGSMIDVGGEGVPD